MTAGPLVLAGAWFYQAICHEMGFDLFRADIDRRLDRLEGRVEVSLEILKLLRIAEDLVDLSCELTSLAVGFHFQAISALELMLVLLNCPQLVHYRAD
jgi:hypothetical protein